MPALVAQVKSSAVQLKKHSNPVEQPVTEVVQPEIAESISRSNEESMQFEVLLCIY
jgi:hypothetical protein